MKRPQDLSKEELVQIVGTVRDWLWLTEDPMEEVGEVHGKKFLAACKKADKRANSRKFVEYFDPGKEWDGDTVDGISNELRNHGLAPEKLLPLDAAYRFATPEENWANDEIQFPRLLDEIRAIGVPTNMMCDIAASMDLDNAKIEEIFARASREWERIKANRMKEPKK